jgi:hypothetical protein
MDRRKLLTSGILLAICATATYVLLHDKASLRRIEESLTDRLGFLEESYC